MTLPVRSTIDRRLLVNLRVEPTVAQRLLPAPLTPQLVNGWAVVGVCFLRLRRVRPFGVPARLGATTENAAHRLAVLRETAAGLEPGVYVPRRDTSSRLAALLGGRLLEGELSHARFEVVDEVERLAVSVHGHGLELEVEVAATAAPTPQSELFSTTEAQSRFFQAGAVAYSPSRRRGVVEGVALRCGPWTGTPMAVTHFRSSLFEDEAAFPAGSWCLDSALLVRDLPATWRGAAALDVADADHAVAAPHR